MEGLFGWIGDLFALARSFVPHFTRCRATHGGVKFVNRLFGRGCKVVEIKPGGTWYWPWRTSVHLVPVARQSVDLPAQSLTTRDGKTVMASASIVFSISDVVKAVGVSWDFDDTTQEKGQSGVKRVVARRTWKELVTDYAGDELDSEFEKLARRRLRPYGVRVIEAFLTDMAKHQVIRHVGEGIGPMTLERDEED